MSVQGYVAHVTTPGSPGTQNLTGIVDAAGQAFTPKVGIWIGVGGGSPSQFSYIIQGFDDATTRWGAVSAADYFARTGTAYRSTDSTRSYSLLFTSVGFGVPVVLRSAKITAFGSGTATIVYDADFTADPMYLVLLGGTSLQYKIDHGNINSGGSHSVTGAGFTPTGLIVGHGGVALTHDFGCPVLGWASSVAQQATMTTVEVGYVDPSNTARYQRITAVAAHFTANGTGIAIQNTLTLASFDSDGFTVTSAGTDTDGDWNYLMLGGVACYAGVTTQLTTVGQQILSTPDLLPVILLTASVSAAASTSVQNDAAWGMGASDGTRTIAVWTGNQDNVSPDDPERDNSTTKSVVMGVNPFTTPAATAGLPTFGNGFAAVTWDTVDATARQLLYFAIGTAVAPTPEAVTRAMRRVRRFPLPFDQNVLIFLQRIEFLVQSGVGLSTGQGSDPVIMVRLSKDGGHTFGNEIWLPLGKMGEYLRRAYAYQLGSGRQWVVEVVDTDPIFSALLSCFVDIERGTS